MKNALIFLAITFCILFAFGYSPSSHHKQSECAKVSQAEILALRSVIMATEKSEKSYKETAKEYENKRKFAATCSDLAAQWSVANYTHKAFWLGLIGLGVLVWTLRATRDAAKSAADTLIQARKATESDRAWMVFSEMRFESSIVDGKPFVHFIVRWENAGKTPAIKYKCIIASHVSDSIEGACIFIETQFMPITLPQSVVGPSKGYDSSPTYVSTDDLVEINEGRKFAVLFSEVEYRDIHNLKIVRTASIWQKIIVKKVRNNSTGAEEFHFIGADIFERSGKAT